jgi:hypothetical protein
VLGKATIGRKAEIKAHGTANALYMEQMMAKINSQIDQNSFGALECIKTTPLCPPTLV